MVNFLRKPLNIIMGAFGIATVCVFSIGNSQRAAAITFTSIAGDQDCFGSNAAPCNFASVNSITRELDDGDFDFFDTRDFNWTHDALPTGDITSAILMITTLDVEDNGAGDGDGGGPFDSRLFIDGMEVVGAFDDVFTPDGSADTLLPVNTTTFNLDPSFFAAFADGEINVVLRSSSGTRIDAIAVDFAKLELTFASTPEPSTLLGLGTLALAGGTLLRRKRKA